MASWEEHELAKGIVRYESSKIFNYFKRTRKMLKSFNESKELVFIRDEFDTRIKLYFDVLWVVKHKEIDQFYFLHFHEIKSGKPNYNQLHRQLKYIYPNKFLDFKSARIFRNGIKLQALKSMVPGMSKSVEEQRQYFYIWIKKEYHKDIEQFLVKVGLESKINRQIKIMDFDILEGL